MSSEVFAGGEDLEKDLRQITEEEEEEMVECSSEKNKNNPSVVPK